MACAISCCGIGDALSSAAAQYMADLPAMTGWLGGTKPQRKSVAALAEKTGIPVEWWLRGEGEIPPDAARRFGLQPSGALAPVIQGERMTHGQYQRRNPPPEVNPLPDLHRTAAAQRHPGHLAMFSALVRLWGAGELSWLLDGTTLEQASYLANRAAEVYADRMKSPQASSDPDDMERAVLRTMLSAIWREGATSLPPPTPE